MSQMVRDQAARISALPCFAGKRVDVRPVSDVAESLGMGEGRTNQNFIVDDEISGVRYFVRVGLDLPAYGVTRVKEQAASRAAAESGVGPLVVHAELPDTMVTEFIDGRSLTEAQVKSATIGDDPTLLRAISSTLRRMHATPMPAEMRVASAAANLWAPPDLAPWIALGREGGFDRLPLLGTELDPYLQSVEAYCTATSGGPPPPPCFCHFDLLPDNFVLANAPAAGSDERAVTVVDFEYANVGQAKMDLVVLSMGCALTPEEDRGLIASYLQLATCPEAEFRQFTALKVFAALRETLWGVVAEVSGTSALSPAEARAYTEKNYVKYEAARDAFAALGGK